MNKQSRAGKSYSVQLKSLVKICALVFLLAVSICACGPSPAELSSTATQVAEDIFATQTALAPTATRTFTPSPTLTPTPTHTLTPSPTPTVDIATQERQLVGEVSSLLEQGDPDGVIELCTEAIDADPAFAMPYALRGLIYYGYQDFAAAVEDFDQAFELGIDSDLDKEIGEGMSVKTLYYLRGIANIQLGAYKQAIEDLERFLAVTEPLEYAQWRQDAQYELGEWQVEPQQVSAGQQFDFDFYSIQAPLGTDWGSKMVGPQSIQFGLNEKLNDEQTVYGERTTIASASVEFLDWDLSKEEFLEFACYSMEARNYQTDRHQTLSASCDYWKKSPEACVRYASVFEDYGPSDNPFSPPLILDSYSMLCRHPDFSEVAVFVHYSQRGPQDSLDDDIEQQAEEFFDGFSFNQPDE